MSLPRYTKTSTNELLERYNQELSALGNPNRLSLSDRTLYVFNPDQPDQQPTPYWFGGFEMIINGAMMYLLNAYRDHVNNLATK